MDFVGDIGCTPNEKCEKPKFPAKFCQENAFYEERMMATHIGKAIDPELSQKIATTIRFLAADGVQKAKSGHPGMPMGCADIATVLLTRVLRIDPSDTNWFNRDRFVLSAGHGSMLIYSMLHLAGVLSMDDLKQFRQYGSKTPGHPEVHDVPGVDVTGGPLAAGFATSAGLALAERMLAQRYSDDVIDHFTYVIMGDGCHMEGLSQEAASFAGHLKLGKIIAFYDDNEISIEGSTNIAFTENVNKRYEALGWHVQDIDGHNHDAIAAAVEEAQNDPRPSLIVCHTVIGRGAPKKQGTASSHGEPLGEEEILAAKKAIGWSEETFYVPCEVYDYFKTRRAEWAAIRKEWDAKLAGLEKSEPKAAAEIKRIIAGEMPANWEKARPTFPADPKGMASRASSGKVLNAFAAVIDELVGGSADLAPSNKSEMTAGKWNGYVSAGEYFNRNIHFGVREHAMGNIVNGLALHGLIPFGATFLVFHDYMRAAVRLSSIMHCRSIWLYTHDSFYVGEDGPTHQPVEQLASLRAIPRLHLMRPADANEVAYAWQHALSRKDAPTAFAMTRQDLPTLDREKYACACGTLKGGYVLSDDENAEIMFIATGSEVSLALSVAEELRTQGRKVRIVSMPCLDLFREQPADYQAAVIPASITRRVVLEAGIRQGWEGYLGSDGIFVGKEDFGTSGPYKVLAEKFGFTKEAVLAKIKAAKF